MHIKIYEPLEDEIILMKFSRGHTRHINRVIGANTGLKVVDGVIAMTIGKDE